MTRRMRLLLPVALVVLAAATAAAQAPSSILLSRVAYNTRKNTAKPEGALKATIEALDREIAEASRLGRTSELRRLFAKGLSLLAGNGWSPEQEYAASLVLRSERLFVDPAKLWVVRLEQIFAPSIELKGPLSARVSIRQRPVIAQPAPAAPAQPAAETTVKDLGVFEGPGADLRDAPFLMEINLAGITPGPYRLQAEVLDGDRVIGTTALPVALEANLDDRLARLEAAASRAPESVRGDIRYPADMMRKITLGRVPPTGFDLRRELQRAEEAATAAAAGREWFKGRTGDLARRYHLTAAGEVMPFRLFVPSSYDGSKPYPLIVALHGLGGSENSFFDSYNRLLPPLAEKHGYMVLAPLGYRADGFYGMPIGSDPVSRRAAELSEQDVMESLRLVRSQYAVDPNRIYLMGHSMGAMGTWAIAARHPEVWAALGPFAGRGSDAAAERVKEIPSIVVHGDADPTVPVEGSRHMVAALKKLGAEVQYIEVPGGDHGNVVAPNLEAVLGFFDKHKKN